MDEQIVLRWGLEKCLEPGSLGLLELQTGLAYGICISNIIEGDVILLSEEKFTISLANLVNNATRNFEL